MESENKDDASASRRTVAVTGASGLVGSALCVALQQRGWSPLRIVRRDAADATLAADEIAWNPAANKLDAARLDGVEAVVHLAGENIAGGRWTAVLKQRIRDTRVVGTRFLAESLAKLDRPPRVLVSASAIGYYGDRQDALLAEEHGPGRGFLPDVCVEWENATSPAKARGIRVVNLRIGIVLSAKGGALQKMLLPFRLGAGGRVGSGGQFWSWISLPDLVGVILHSIVTDKLAGPVNAVSPEAVTNREFTHTLGSVLHRPTILPMPAIAARLCGLSVRLLMAYRSLCLLIPVSRNGADCRDWFRLSQSQSRRPVRLELAAVGVIVFLANALFGVDDFLHHRLAHEHPERSQPVVTAKLRRRRSRSQQLVHHLFKSRDSFVLRQLGR